VEPPPGAAAVVRTARMLVEGRTSRSRTYQVESIGDDRPQLGGCRPVAATSIE
jgi:hypothetical protein